MKKYLKYLFTLIVVAIILYFSTILNINIIPDTSNSNNTAQENEVNVYNFEKAYVSRIVDGDTIEVKIDNQKYKVRFIGINCPENTSKTEYYGKESTEYTSKMLKDNYVYLEKDVSNTDKYGRLLRYVWLEMPNDNTTIEIRNNMFNAILLYNGYAQVATYPPDIRHSILFKNLSSEARNNNCGLWKK